MKPPFSRLQIILSLLIVFILFFSCNSGAVQNITVQQIWGKYINNYGSKAKIKNIQSYYGKMTRSYGIYPYECELYSKGKDKLVFITTYPDRKITIKLNGLKGIEISQNKVRKLSEEEIEKIRMFGHLFAEIDFVDKGYKFELIGIEKIDGNESYKLKVITDKNEAQFYYIDTKTFYLNKLEDKFGESYYSDYRKVDGFLCCFKGRDIVNHIVDSFVKTEVKYNPVIEDTLFEITN